MLSYCFPSRTPQVVCGVCHSYSAHLYQRLGPELDTLDGMTMKTAFCNELVDACKDEIPAVVKTYDGLSYCEKHVGDTGDQFWSYPYTERESSRPRSNLFRVGDLLAHVTHIEREPSTNDFTRRWFFNWRTRYIGTGTSHFRTRTHHPTPS